MDMVGALKQWAWYLQNIQKITMESEDARWLLTTTADSYAPRVPVEKSWETHRVPSK